MFASANDPSKGWVRLGDVPRPKTPPFIVEDLIHHSSTLVYGRPKSGKSSCLLCLARSLVTGEPYLDRKVRERRNVAYMMLDSGQVAETKNRSEEMRLSVDDVMVTSARPGHTRDDWRRLAAILTGLGVDVLFIDNLFRIMRPGTSIRNDEHIGEVLDNLKEIEDAGLALVLTHHLGKPSENGYSPTSPLGSTALEGYFRHFMRIEHNRSTGERALVAYGNDLKVDEVRIPVEITDEGVVSGEARDAARDKERFAMIEGKAFRNQGEIAALWGVEQQQVSKIMRRLKVKRDRTTGRITPV
jgi:hypothetical protein